MREHPIPQDVTGYRFHIVGNMTLGQFVQLAIGVSAAVGIWMTNLLLVIKLPLALLLAAAGVIAAFIPIAERPLSHWVVTFYSILWKPTKYFWKRIPLVPEYFTFKRRDESQPLTQEVDLTPLRRARIHEYISSTVMERPISAEDQYEAAQLQNVFDLFTTEKVIVQSETTVVNKPQLKVRVRSMRSNPSTSLSVENALSDPSLEGLVAAGERAAEQFEQSDNQEGQLSPLFGAAAGATVNSSSTEDTSQTTYRSDLSTDVSSLNNIPENNPTSVLSSSANTLTPSDSDSSQDANGLSATDSAADTPLVVPPPAGQLSVQTVDGDQSSQPTSAVTFNTELPFPSRPTTPNKLVGMVLTTNNELIDGAIVEIRTKSSQVARAVRTNALGQFYVTTPLKNGTYTLIAEHADYEFQPQTITLSGKIVDPLEIRSNPSP